jgi:hypothetical protein
MVHKTLRFVVKASVLSSVYCSLSHAESAPRQSAPRESPFERASYPHFGQGIERRLTSPLPPAVKSGGLRMPSFIAWPPGLPNSGYSSKHLALGVGTTECVIHCVERRSVDPGMSLASVVLAGVGAAGLATGLVLVIATPPGGPDTTSLVPSFRVRVSGQRALASARWRF